MFADRPEFCYPRKIKSQSPSPHDHFPTQERGHDKEQALSNELKKGFDERKNHRSMGEPIFLSLYLILPSGF